MKKLVFIPVGSYEQHGPHLPPETDYLIARKIVKDVSELFNGIFIEGIKIGISPEHLGFESTKTISQQEFTSQIKRILKELQVNDKIIFINAHGGNISTLNLIQKWNKEKMLVLNTFSLIKEDLISVRTSDIGGICHAGEFETSIMLYLYPNEVKMKSLKKDDIKYVPSLDPNYEKEKPSNWKTITYSNSGVLGDPFHGTYRKGEVWYNSLINRINTLIKGNIT